MPETPEFPAAADRARIIATALGLGQRVDFWSLAILIFTATILVLERPPRIVGWFLLSSLLAGSIQKFFALRVAFDEAVFRHWTGIWNTKAEHNASPEAELLTFDRALADCSLCQMPDHNAVRGLDSRIKGARRLIQRQMLAFGLQGATLIIGLSALLLA